MATVKLDIALPILQWIYSSYAEKIDENLTMKINTWISGAQKPTFTEIENLSKKTKIPFGYFFLNEPPKEDLPILEYRTVDSAEIANPSRELIDTVSYMEFVQGYLREFRRDIGYGKCEAVGAGKNLSIQDFTKRIREVLTLEKEWYKGARGELFNLLRSKLEDVGVVIMKNGIVANNTRRALNYREFRAFTMIDSYAPLIFINSTDTNNGQIFSLLHEFAHILLGESNFYNARISGTNTSRNNEIICNAVTAEILVPSDIFCVKWEQERDIFKLADYFCCSAIVVARKALDSNYINQSKYDDVCKFVIQKADESREKRKEQESGGNFYNTAKSRIDRNFLEAVYIGVSEGKITYTEAYRLTNTKRTSFMGLIDQMALGGVV